MGDLSVRREGWDGGPVCEAGGVDAWDRSVRREGWDGGPVCEEGGVGKPVHEGEAEWGSLLGIMLAVIASAQLTVHKRSNPIWDPVQSYQKICCST